MISREEIRELADFQASKKAECAVSFYFQPNTPQNKSHREETILVKDLVRKSIQEAEKEGKNECVRSDLHRILEIASGLHGNQARAKAIFACNSRGLWKEFDLPPQFPGTQIVVNRRFHLKPLAMLLGAQPTVNVVVLDRKRARFFTTRLDEISEREDFFHPLPRRGRSDGWGGYDGGHAERRVNEEAMQHFKTLAEHLTMEVEKGMWDKLIVGSLEKNWHEFEPYLHPYVRQRLVGHFSADVAEITPEKVRSKAQQILNTNLEHRRQELLKDVLSFAKSHRRGVTGLRRVLKSLELGEVQALLLGENYAARGVECTSCGRLDAHLVKYCALCGHSTRRLDDICEAIIPTAIRRDIEVFYLNNEELDKVGNIAALLRFRVGQGRNHQLAEAS